MSNIRAHKVAVIIGRFQPFHKAHLAMLRQALAVGESVFVVLGSSYKAPDVKNPFSEVERAEMIRAALTPQENAQVTFVPMADLNDDDLWVRHIKHKVTSISQSNDIALVGHFKDASSYYLGLFPGWTLVPTETDYEGLDATHIRKQLFEGEALEAELLPAGVLQWLNDWSKTDACTALQAEYAQLKAYKKTWEAAPYPPTFVTADAVVHCNGHVLLIQRKRAPGKGLWAVPGGFLEQDETVLQGALREMMEETGLVSSAHELIATKLFDKANRSLRGRTITHAHYFNLEDREELPKVLAADDAQALRWVPLSEIASMQSQFFEDHFHIVMYLRQLDFEIPLAHRPFDPSGIFDPANAHLFTADAARKAFSHVKV
ncbi:bifunctional nicotinamide-nucleotide adenylyltransferase/Nudix hydroxylase [Nostoc sp. CHAB 5834]|nr:bifunctional nicotinamide-nucleotide adenylyltransferase/Nudix hydroxylase [Nostoc sp. CHAB 5834]